MGISIYINLQNIYENLLALKNRSGGKNVLPVLKANAYGHGSVPVAKFLYSKGVYILQWYDEFLSWYCRSFDITIFFR